jgi:hypothetical protein
MKMYKEGTLGHPNTPFSGANHNLGLLRKIMQRGN